MSLCVALKVFNEIEYISYAISQFYNTADRLLILEGCDSYMRISTDRVTSEGLSVDGTTEVISSFPDPDGKIEHIKLGFYQEEEECWQRMLLDMKKGDVLWTAAADEFFFSEDIQIVKRILEEGKYLTARFPFRTYWHDFYHVLRGGGWDNELARAFVLSEDQMTMVGKGASLRDSQGRDYTSSFYVGTTWVSPTILHHFSYVRTAEKIMEKQCWQLEIEDRFSAATENSPISSSGLDCYLLKKRYRTPQRYIARNFSWFTAEYDERFGIYAERFDGPRPEALSDHPYRYFVWDEEPTIWGGNLNV